VNRGRIVEVTTSDMSLSLLLGPQLDAFVRAGYEVIGVSGPGPFAASLADLGVRHIPVRSLTRAVDVRSDLRAPIDLYRLFRSLRPDLVHTHNPKTGVYGRLAARAARVPAVVNTVHGLYALPEDRFAKRALVYGLERIAATCSDAELVVNPEDLETLRRLGVPERRLHLLSNGIDLRRFDPASVSPARVAEVRAEVGAKPDDVVVGAVGRLVWEKGYRELFAAAATLRERRPEVRIFVAGPMDADKADAVTTADVEAATRLGITFLGMRDDVEDLYAAMDLYVLASHREGWPLSAMEAAAMGVPVIATDIRGCRQIVDDGRTGLLVPPRDGPALAEAIDALAGDPARRAEMAAAVRAKAVRDFDDRRQIDVVLAVYQELLGEHPGDPRHA
jgi:glycosyltransferase involved in cell wall biosynthesis